MSTTFLLGLFRTYLEMGILLILASGLLTILPAVLGKCRIHVRNAHWLRIANSMAACSLLYPLVALLLPKEALLRPSAQVWSELGRSSAVREVLVSGMDLSALTTQSSLRDSGIALSHQIIGYVLIVLGIGIGIGLLRFSIQVFRLYRFLESQLAVKSIGRIRVLISEDAVTPFSAWMPGCAYVVLPALMITQPEDFRISLRHEVQHHRQGDTQWVYLIELIKAFFFWNPAAHGLSRVITKFQEFACDEALIGRRNVSPQAYGSCLLRVAESAVGSRPILMGTASMAASSSGILLKRRIETMFDQQTKAAKKWISAVLAVGTLGVMASAAFAAKSSIQDRQLTMSEAQGYAEVASQRSEIPITVNELVLQKLNRYVGTLEGRKFVKEGLMRMPNYQAMIERKIAEYQMPSELIALALYESGFSNDLISPRPHYAAGIWQFIPSTARRYGLIAQDEWEDMVPEKDERFDPERETDAAMRYLRDLHGLFHDWRLAVKAYNEGEVRVQQLIDQHGTRDPWALERKSSRESYLSGAMAMIIILKNPSLID